MMLVHDLQQQKRKFLSRIRKRCRPQERYIATLPWITFF